MWTVRWCSAQVDPRSRGAGGVRDGLPPTSASVAGVVDRLPPADPRRGGLRGLRRLGVQPPARAVPSPRSCLELGSTLAPVLQCPALSARSARGTAIARW
jgi:hypothetical protein